MAYTSTKKPGNILSAFCPENESTLPLKYLELKQELAQDTEKLAQSWNRLLRAFEKETELIQQKGSEIIPQISFSEISDGNFPQEFKQEVWKRGCLVVRNVVEEEVALDYKKSILNYINNHPGSIRGFPDDNPQVWELYWSKAQVAARSHPNFVKVARAVNQLWSATPETPIDFSTNLTYCDRLRIRQPGDTSFALGEHIDGGSVERWEDPEYRKCYSHILNGEWEQHNSFDATHRIGANMDMYNCSGGCSMFRTFQGWMSLSNVKPNGGTLRLCPLIKLTTAYVILRPLMPDLFTTTNMAGAIPGVQQNILADIHPHIVNAVISIPEVNPGDCTFWHCDSVHAVDSNCKSDSSVLYIPTTPLCSKNAEYVAKQRHAFENGLTPQDFPLNNCEVDFEDRARFDDLTEIGKVGMGFRKFIHNQTDAKHGGAAEAAARANRVLGF